jgi:allophanate hydrolase
MSINELPLTIAHLQRVYSEGLKPAELVREVKRRVALASKNPIWIHLLSDEELAPHLAYLDGYAPGDLPLYGVPFAIKDNIDLAMVPTTAACPAFAYTPRDSAFVVACLLRAGAIPIGKTNLDQLATGLVGTRSPFGAVSNAFDESLISGGSSAGSAVSVALGQVTFSLGTDTAGSGRVPAALNNLIGYKPTRGLLSTTGVVPACKTLDCVSIFGLNIEDVQQVASVAVEYDAADAYARLPALSKPLHKSIQHLRVGLPEPSQLTFFGDETYEGLFGRVTKEVSEQYDTCVKDISPLLAAAKLLYEGAWVAERYHAAKELIEHQPEALREEFLAVVSSATSLSAVDYFDGAYRLAEFKRQAELLFSDIDVLLLPTVGTHYSLADVAKSPLQRNSDNGFYTNFVNLLDMAALAIPAGFTKAGLPFGISLIGEAMTDDALLTFGRQLLAGKGQFQQRKIGATGVNMTEPLAVPTLTDTMPIAVCGAHLSGMPLNGQLLERHGVLREATTSAPCYRLYALPGGPPMRPGLVRTATGVCIDVEVYDVPKLHVGSFLAGIPKPLGLGQLELASGEWVSGFICEPAGIDGAEDVSAFGGWRAYIASL